MTDPCSIHGTPYDPQNITKSDSYSSANQGVYPCEPTREDKDKNNNKKEVSVY